MVLVTYSSELVNDAKILSTLDHAFFNELLGFALKNLAGEKLHPKMYAKLATEMNVEPEVVRNASFTIAAIVVEAAKKNAEPNDFTQALSDFELSSDNSASLTSAYTEIFPTLRADLSQCSLQQTTYRSIDWRLDVEVGTRSLRNEVKPSFLLALETDDPVKGARTQMLQTDLATLQHVADELQRAVAEGKNAHARRIQRYVK